jgi:hypothetical protein
VVLVLAVNVAGESDEGRVGGGGGRRIGSRRWRRWRRWRRRGVVAVDVVDGVGHVGLARADKVIVAGGSADGGSRSPEVLVPIEQGS